MLGTTTSILLRLGSIKEIKREGIHMNLKGFIIGNGLRDPTIQYKAYTDYALEMSIIQEPGVLSVCVCIYPIRTVHMKISMRTLPWGHMVEHMETG